MAAAARQSASELADFVYREARLIDEKRFEEWYELFTADARYWMPLTRGQPEGEMHTSLFNEDKLLLKLRITRLRSPNAFSQQQVNGVLIFDDKNDRQSYVLGDRAAVQAGWWSTQTSQSIVQAMNAQFRAGDYDGGITSAVSGALNVYRSHLNALSGGSSVATRTAPAQQPAQGGVHISVFWWIIIALFAFFILRSIMRAMSGPRSYGGGPGYGPGGPGYGGYGGGYGWGGGGGVWSGRLGGLGGAFLGHELFGRGGWGGGGFGGGADQNAGNVAPSDGGGWQSDPGQADMGSGAGGDWGGGGFGGGGDFGGGGGGFGGGGGDAGGGW